MKDIALMFTLAGLVFILVFWIFTFLKFLYLIFNPAFL